MNSTQATPPELPDPNEQPESSDPADDAVIAKAFKGSMILIAVVGLPAVAVLIFIATRPALVEKFVAETAVPRLRVDDPDAIPKIPLVDVTEAAGIDFIHQSGRRGEKLLPETMGSGVAVFDANGDGHADLFFPNSTLWPWAPSTTNKASGNEASVHSLTSKLYLGDGRGAFTDATVGSKLDLNLYAMGAAVGDFDNDGDADIFVSAVGQNRLFRNDTADPSEPRFTDITEASGVGGDTESWSTSCGFFDYDNDGLLDLLVCNYVTWDRDSDLSQSFTLDGQTRAYGPPRAFAGSFPTLFHNEGGGRFVDVSEPAGLQIRSPDTRVPLAKSMGVVFADVNADDYLDIIIANDTVPNFLFENNRDGTFTEVGRLLGIAFDRDGAARGAMGVDCGFLRNDDTLAIAIGNFANEPSALYMARPAKRQFIDAAMFTGFGPPTRQALTFGTLFFDANLDGRLDVLGANGHLEDDIARTQTSQTYAQSPQLFFNAGVEASSELVLLSEQSVGRDFMRPIVGRGAAVGDFDEDGDDDIVITTSHSSPKLFRNDQQTGNAFVQVRLRGTKCNRDAIGAIATLKVGDYRVRRCLNPTHSYLSQSEPILKFGIEKSVISQNPEMKAALEVRWPGGETETYPIDRFNERYKIVQGQSPAIEGSSTQ